MDIFKTNSGHELKLTLNNFEDATNKRFPYYNGGKFFAYCPKCNNVVQIINLYTDEYMQNETRIIKTYAKHINKHIAGFDENLAKFSFNLCPLYKPCSLGNTKISHDEFYAEINKEFLEKNKNKIREVLSEIVGLKISNSIFERLMEKFIGGNFYKYKAVNEYNMPYALLYYTQSLNVYKQEVIDNKIGNEILYSIRENSKWFYVEGRFYKKNKENDYVQIEILFKNYKKANGCEKITYQIQEVFEDDVNVIFTSEITLDSIIF